MERFFGETTSRMKGPAGPNHPGIDILAPRAVQDRILCIEHLNDRPANQFLNRVEGTGPR